MLRMQTLLEGIGWGREGGGGLPWRARPSACCSAAGSPPPGCAASPAASPSRSAAPPLPATAADETARFQCCDSKQKRSLQQGELMSKMIRTKEEKNPPELSCSYSEPEERRKKQQMKDANLHSICSVMFVTQIFSDYYCVLLNQ